MPARLDERLFGSTPPLFRGTALTRGCLCRLLRALEIGFGLCERFAGVLHRLGRPVLFARRAGNLELFSFGCVLRVSDRAFGGGDRFARADEDRGSPFGVEWAPRVAAATGREATGFAALALPAATDSPASISKPPGCTAWVSRPGASVPGSDRMVVADRLPGRIRHRVTAIGQQPQRRLHCGLRRIVVNLARGANVTGPSGQHRLVRPPCVLGRRDQVVPDIAVLPIELVDRPGRDRRLHERAMRAASDPDVLASALRADVNSSSGSW